MPGVRISCEAESEFLLDKPHLTTVYLNGKLTWRVVEAESGPKGWVRLVNGERKEGKVVFKYENQELADDEWKTKYRKYRKPRRTKAG